MRSRRRQHSRIRRALTRLAVLVGLAAFLGSFAAVLLLTVGSGEGSPTTTRPRTVAAAPAPRAPARPRAKPKPRPAPKKRAAPPRLPVQLVAVGTYDPKGDQHEKDELVARATDRDPASYWTTETYSTWGWKPGVGLVLDAHRPLRLIRLTVVSDTPGFTAQIQAGPSPDGPFAPVSASRSAGRTTVFRLAEPAPRRYLLVWITQLAPERTKGGAVHVNEVRAIR